MYESLVEHVWSCIYFMKYNAKFTIWLIEWPSNMTAWSLNILQQIKRHKDTKRQCAISESHRVNHVNWKFRDTVTFYQKFLFLKVFLLLILVEKKQIYDEADNPGGSQDLDINSGVDRQSWLDHCSSLKCQHPPKILKVATPSFHAIPPLVVARLSQNAKIR